MKTIIVSAFLIFKMLFSQYSFAMEKDSYPIDGGLADKFKYLVTQYEKGDYRGNEFEESGFSISSITPKFGSGILTTVAGNHTYQGNQLGRTVISGGMALGSSVEPVRIDPPVIVNLKELYKLFLKIEDDQFFQNNVTDAKQRASSLELEEYARDFLINLKLLERMKNCMPMCKAIKTFTHPLNEFSCVIHNIEIEFDIFQYMARLASKKQYTDLVQSFSEYDFGTVLFERQVNEKKQVITIDMMFKAILEQADYLKAHEYKENKFQKFYKKLSGHLYQTYVFTTHKGRSEHLESCFQETTKDGLAYLISKGIAEGKLDHKWVFERFEELNECKKSFKIGNGKQAKSKAKEALMLVNKATDKVEQPKQ